MGMTCVLTIVVVQVDHVKFDCKETLLRDVIDDDTVHPELCGSWLERHCLQTQTPSQSTLKIQHIQNTIAYYVIQRFAQTQFNRLKWTAPCYSKVPFCLGLSELFVVFKGKMCTITSFVLCTHPRVLATFQFLLIFLLDAHECVFSQSSSSMSE